ncbi:acyl-coenzyme A diphosphatase NUDT19 isoform X2 [Cuculus canorus]|uniref:acyl-coenzyme A diphosphatase NUDT19 isoform X2 n=1 Tax=Cuculus canorus TaxID=55661 RepID=UPI0023AAC5CE|nr:acyl-coenzyme A diphosphatase NUDT19 isoform X2 [Cuculus canorus]
MPAAPRPWREAATLLLAARRPPGPPGCGRGRCDYQLLLLQRSGRSGFMPGAHVFPGGLAEPDDFSAEWLELLPPPPRCGLRAVKPPPPGCDRAPLFSAERGSALPGDVALRLCALREAFEEAGVLLSVPERGAEALPEAELREWRRRVREEPRGFLQLCRRLRCRPDIWALREWSNWLTPARGAGQRRYDTAFYLCCRDRRPPRARHDGGEVTACLELDKFSYDRAIEGCERWMPVELTASDGSMQLLPGDELYPEDPDYTGEKNMVISTDKKVDDLMKEGSVFHRIIIRNTNNLAIYVNIQAKYKHVNPVMINSSCSEYSSKL